MMSTIEERLDLIEEFLGPEFNTLKEETAEIKDFMTARHEDTPKTRLRLTKDALVREEEHEEEE